MAWHDLGISFVVDLIHETLQSLRLSESQLQQKSAEGSFFCTVELKTKLRSYNNQVINNMLTDDHAELSCS